MPLSLFGLSTLHKGLMSSVLSIRLSVTPLSQDWLKRFSDFSHEARIHKHKCDKTHFLKGNPYAQNRGNAQSQDF